MSKRVIKFQKQNCSPCEQVDKWLKDHNVEYETINPYDSPEKAVQYKVRSVPTVLLYEGDSEIGRVVGYKPEMLSDVLGFLTNV